MKHILAFLICALPIAAQTPDYGIDARPGSTYNLASAAKTKTSRQVASDPVTCEPGENIFNTTANKQKVCGPANTWTIQDASGGGSVPDTVLHDVSTYRYGSLTFPGQGTAWTGVGDYPNPTGTTTVGTLADTVPAHGNIASAGTIDSLAALNGAANFRTGRDLYFKALVQPVETTAVRMYVGLTTGNSANATTSPMATGYWAGFRYDPALDTNWRCVADTGTGTLTTADSGISFAAAWRRMFVWLDEANGTARYYIDGSQVCAITSNFPVAASHQNMRAMAAVRTTEAVAKNLRIAYLQVRSNLVN